MIAGAPRCATTTVYKTLQQHPGIFLPWIKEPQYFAFDHLRGRAVERIDRYDALYTAASENQLRGDASVMYLISARAIPAIVERRPDAKFIVFIRDPAEIFISSHNECLRSLDEDEEDPERAWQLQEERADGWIPKLCKEPSHLQYRRICSVGRQIQRLFDLVPEDRRLVIVLGSLNQRPALIHRQIAAFLGIEDIVPGEFFRENVFSSHSSRAAARLTRLVHVSPFFKDLRLRLKPILNRHGIYPLTWVVNYSLTPRAKPNLTEGFELELRQEFGHDTILLEKLLGRDFSRWLGEAAPSVRQSRSAGASLGSRSL